jgi:hypothetical protein
MPSPVYQNMVNLIVVFPIWGHPSMFMDAAMWELCTFDLRFLDVTKFTTLTPSSILISCNFHSQL